jgi:hypothetical protein
MLIHKIANAIVLIPSAILICLALIFSTDKFLYELHRRVTVRRRGPVQRVATRVPMVAVGAEEADRA